LLPTGTGIKPNGYPSRLRRGQKLTKTKETKFF